MNKRNYLEENIEALLGKTEPELKLPEPKKQEMLAKLLNEAGALSERGTARILKSWVVRSAVAAVLVIVAGLIIIVLNESGTPAYAIGQTIEALQSVTTVHVLGTDWDGNRYEAWNRINPETGKAEWVCIDQTPHGYKIASTPKGSCVWDKDGNVVRYSNHAIASNDFRYGHVFEDLSNQMLNLNDDERITIYTEKDPGSGRKVIVIWSITRMQDFKVYVDPGTKLPIRIYFDRADNMVQIAKSVDRIFYNVELPEGMFDFEVPQKWVRDYSVLDDPAKGLSAEGLSREEGSIKIAREYWHALIDGNWDYVAQLRPLGNWKNDYRKDRPTELIDVNLPYTERGCSGLVVPCVVRFEDGKVMEVELVVNYRKLGVRTSCIIVATWGWPKVRNIE